MSSPKVFDSSNNTTFMVPINANNAIMCENWVMLSKD